MSDKTSDLFLDMNSLSVRLQRIKCYVIRTLLITMITIRV